jgi:two-component sensor histidine kinase
MARAKKSRELHRIKRELDKISKRLAALASEGVDVETVKTAMNDLSNKVDALIAAKFSGTGTSTGSTGITAEEAAAIAQGINAIGDRITASLAAPAVG